jgi:DNA-binding MarR family transcriptional regulator
MSTFPEPLAADHPGASPDPLDANFSMTSWPFYWVTRAGRRYSHSLDVALKRIGMDVARWRVLMILTEYSPASISELADHGVSKLSTMTKTVQRMEAQGLVTTRVRDSDARVTEVMLTDTGRETVAIVRGSASRLFHLAFEGISEAELLTLNDILSRLHGNLEQLPR